MKKIFQQFIFALLALLVVITFTTKARADLTPTFRFMAPGWISPPLTISMTPYWGAFGLPDQGVNYYSSGAPRAPSPYWERFDPTSDLYEAWFGSYVVNDFPCASEWAHPTPTTMPCTVANVQALAFVDQYVWLAAYGDPSPLAQVDPASVVVLPAPDGYFVMYAQIASHSDLGAPTSLYGFDPPYSLYSSVVPPYQPVTLNSVARFKYIPSANELVIVYASGTQWTLLDGTKKCTPPVVEAEQLAMVFSTTFD